MPERGAIGPGGHVAALEFAGEAEAHGDGGDERGVVELGGGYAEPIAEAFAAGVVPGDAGLVGDSAWGLADDEDA